MKIKTNEIQKDNDLFDIPRDSCSDVFSWVLKASLWPISPGISSRRTFNPCFASSSAVLIEASDVQILEAEWNSGEDCKCTAEGGLKKGWTPIEIGTKIKSLNDLKQAGKQKQCYLGIRSFFTSLTTYMQKSLAFQKLLIEAFLCLHPDQKTGIRSIQKIRVVRSSLPCGKPEEFTFLTDEWEHMQKQISHKNGYRRKMEHLSELFNTGNKFCSWSLH